MDSLTLLLVPKNRKVEFKIEVIIQELTNVPLVTGLYYVKWRLKNGEKPNGMTSRTYIKDHSVVWNYKLEKLAQIVIGKDGVLMPYELKLKIKQELNGGKEINNIGKLSLNLSEYVGLNAMIRRYLLQDSKINSTLKLTINMKQTMGDTGYKVPPLKKTHIFGGIAGIISEQREQSERQDDERSTRAFRSSFNPHYMKRPRSNSSLRSAFYAQATHVTPITSSLMANSFLRKVGDKSPTDVVEEIFMGTAVLHGDEEENDDVSNNNVKR